MAEEISAAPPWAATTLKWLKENAYSYATLGVQKEPWKMLAGALRILCFDKASTEGIEPLKNYEKRMDSLAASWNGDLHSELVNFLKNGGYAAEKLIYAAMRDDVAIEGDDGNPMSPDTVSVRQNGGPPAAPVVEQGLDEALATEIRRQDDRAGSW
jgi:hypothetical protein